MPEGNGPKLPYIHEIDGVRFLAGLQILFASYFPERFANGNPNLTLSGAREWDAAIAISNRMTLVEIYKDHRPFRLS